MGRSNQLNVKWLTGDVRSTLKQQFPGASRKTVTRKDNASGMTDRLNPSCCMSVWRQESWGWDDLRFGQLSEVPTNTMCRCKTNRTTVSPIEHLNVIELMWWFNLEVSLIGSGVRTFRPQLVVLFKGSSGTVGMHHHAQFQFFTSKSHSKIESQKQY